MWIHFAVAACFVVAAGILIGRVAGALGERLGLGKAWAGAVLLSLATTLPELVSSLTVTLRGEPAMAVGGILGSVLFNLFIFVIVDVSDPAPIYHRLSTGHMLTGLLGCALLATAAAGLASGLVGGDALGEFHAVGWASLPAIAIIALYLTGQFVMFVAARGNGGGESDAHNAAAIERLGTRTLVALYIGLVGVILVAAYNLGLSSERIAARYNLSATFAGATLLGIVTSLPEITNGVSCARRREFDLAAGNIFGANAFVIVVLAICDFAWLRGSLFAHIGRLDAISGIVMAGIGIVMQTVVLFTLAARTTARIWRIGMASVVLAALYALSLLVAKGFSTIAP